MKMSEDNRITFNQSNKIKKKDIIMNTSETLEKMTEMRLLGMKQAYSLYLGTTASGKITND